MKFYEASEYQEKVDQIFEKLSALLNECLSGVRIEHIGASSIPGAVSKGDLDVFVGVAKEDFNTSLDKIKSLGFVEKEGTLKTQSLCMLITEQFNHDVAIQLVETGSEFEDFLVFRDLLCANRTLVEEYNELKRSSSELNEDDYRSRKSQWVKNLLKSDI